MKQSQRIVKNALFGVVAAVGGGAIQLATVLLVARSVGVEDFGIYSFVIAFAMIFQLIADAGLSNILVRELATAKDGIERLFGAAKGLIWTSSILIAGLMCVVVFFLHVGNDIKGMILVMGVATLTQFHCAGFTAVLRAHEDNEINTAGHMLQKILFFVLVFASLRLGWGLWGVIGGNLASTLTQCGFYAFVVGRRFGLPRPRYDWPLWRNMIVNAIPLGGGTMLRQLSLQLDILILKALTNLHTVGLFSGPYRIGMALRLIPQVISLPLYPMLSRLAKEDTVKFGEAYVRSMKMFAIFAFPVSVTVVMWSRPMILKLMGPEYVSSTPAMQLVGAGLVPFFMASLFPFLLTAIHEQKFFLMSSLAGTLLRVALNFVLIPMYGFLGPCYAFLLAEAMQMAMWVWHMNRKGFPCNLLTILPRPALAACGMAAILYFARDLPFLLLPFVAIFGFIVYLGLLIVVGTFSKEEIRLAREGGGFLKPFIQQWKSGGLRRRP